MGHDHQRHAAAVEFFQQAGTALVAGMAVQVAGGLVGQNEGGF